MFKERFKKRGLPFLISITAIVIMCLSMIAGASEGDTNLMARKVSSKVENRLSILDSNIDKVISGEYDKIDIPKDMVIYRYVNDSLTTWWNQFPIITDDISNKHIFQRLTNKHRFYTSPLISASESFSYMSLGPKWYLVKMVQIGNQEKIYAGLEIKDTMLDDLRSTENGVNPKLKLPGRYTLTPLIESGGSPVIINGTALFKIIYTSGKDSIFFDNAILKWIAVMLFYIAIVVMHMARRTLMSYLISVIALAMTFIVSIMWGLRMSSSISLFSPSVYADGPIFASLGMLVLLNTFITVFNSCTFIVKDSLLDSISRNSANRKRNLTIFSLIILLATVAMSVYIHITIVSVIMNSNISLELYKWNNSLGYTILVYVSWIGLYFCILLMLQMLRPIAKEFLEFRYNIFSKRSLTIAALIGALYFTLVSGFLGFKKEEDRVSVWSNRLAVERDLTLEIQLRSVENSIADDQIISALVSIDNTSSMILNRITDYYLNRIKKSYSTNVTNYHEKSIEGAARFDEISRNGTPIADGSRFYFLTDANGRSSYAGLFLYYSEDYGLRRVLIEIESNNNKDERGYYSILGSLSNPGKINIPPIYTYAKYIDNKLISYKGNYPYPTILDYSETDRMKSGDEKVSRDKKFLHFIHTVSDEELVIISRPKRNFLVFFTSFSYLFLIMWGVMILCSNEKRVKKTFRHNYFRRRIITILLISSLFILLSLAIVSITFVYKRNEVNMNHMMSAKIGMIQDQVENQMNKAKTYNDLINPSFFKTLEGIARINKCDITLYTPNGKVFYSTTPEVFEKMIIGSRIHHDAYMNIKKKHQRFYILKRELAGFKYWSLFAPIFNYDGEMIAIIGMPYTNRNQDFMTEAFFHAAVVINFFALLVILSLLFTKREVKSLFKPLTEMSKKMNAIDIHNLEHIVYKRDDEISSLVEAYNRMVSDLAESSRLLAQNERDKAWSEMARQVAHEIKNPLTPIKLEIQRLIRLKHNNNPAWEEKFDKVSSVILEHIDILTDTANEFSTFAKLYSEDPVIINLDKILKDQLIIFDNKENIKFSYIGMEEAYVMAPKPQLIRVFVNLINNAIQAIEINQHEQIEKNEKVTGGVVLICLRNSTKDGYYDIVFDDNGPGVSEENMVKLFTPNFTTKSAGTGLGLAICRNIIEKCEGEIHYQKSFALGGASFIITLPKHKA